MTKNIISLIDDLVKTSIENEWIEFKHNFHSHEEIGERISALANGACLHGQAYGYLVFGVDDSTRCIIGTSFNPKTKKKGSEDLEHWLISKLIPKIDFRSYFVEYAPNVFVSLYMIPAATNRPVMFLNTAYIRIGSYTKKLMEYPEKEAKIWRKNQERTIDKDSAKSGLSARDVIELLSTHTYYELLKIPYPTNQLEVIERMLRENVIVKDKDNYAITKMGAILLGKDLDEFEVISRKAVRVIVYKGTNKVETIRDIFGRKGYAVGFEGLIDWINSQLPANEEIGKALRKEARMYPEIAVRELVANAIIHQDFAELGFPMIEIFSDRIEISNPGIPLVTPDRFIDANRSRNEKLADIMRRMGFCEEKGSGFDKVIFYNEFYQLPAINIDISEQRTKVVIYSYKRLNSLDRNEKIRACYQHACLKYVSNDKMIK
jgi:Predicted transcriptional regulator containing an HTH domain and an uncharacterized domain shared with the mammalian protein Schlafen